MRSLRVTVFVFGVVATAIAALFVAAAPASSAPPNCATLGARIAQYEQARVNHNSRQPDPRDAAAVQQYNYEAQQGRAWGQALANEQAQCRALGYQTPRIRSGGEPPAPGVRPQTPRLPAPPQQDQTVPGSPALPSYPEGQRSVIARDVTTAGGGREVTFTDGGKLTWGPPGGQLSAYGTVKADALKAGTPTLGARTGYDPPGIGPGLVRGHLISSRYGGLGTDPRNLVTLTYSANLRMRSVENDVVAALRRGCPEGVLVSTTAFFLPVQAAPVVILMSALGCGVSRTELIPNI